MRLPGDYVPRSRGNGSVGRRGPPRRFGSRTCGCHAQRRGQSRAAARSQKRRTRAGPGLFVEVHRQRDARHLCGTCRAGSGAVNTIAIRSVLMLSPEPPYPLDGGGAYRTASLVHYFSRFADVDLIPHLGERQADPSAAGSGSFAKGNRPAAARQGNAGPVHSQCRPGAARRSSADRPPERTRPGAGRSSRGRRYDIGIVEHFWCAPYVSQIRNVCEQTVLESAQHRIGAAREVRGGRRARVSRERAPALRRPEPKTGE